MRIEIKEKKKKKYERIYILSAVFISTLLASILIWFKPIFVVFIILSFLSYMIDTFYLEIKK